MTRQRQRTIEQAVVAWLEAQLRVAARPGPARTEPLIDLGLGARETYLLLSELRRLLIRHVLASRAEEALSGQTIRDLKHIERWFDEVLLDALAPSVSKSQPQLDREERLVMLGQLVASLIHELRNPLSVIDTSLLLIERRATRGQAVEGHVLRARAQVDRSRKMIDDLLDMLRDRPVQRRRTTLEPLIASVLDAIGSDRSRIRVNLGAGVSAVEIDADQIQQVVLNLLTNALEASAPEDPVQLDVRNAGDEVVLEVGDQGPGIPTHVLATLFEPLVSTKPGGVGMGLAVSRRLAEQNLGRLEGQNNEGGRGARFRLMLPSAAKASEPPLLPRGPVT